jgi:cell division protein FtsN
MSRKLLVAAFCTLVPSFAVAQTNADSAAYKRAQQLVNDGNAVAGRALVDSTIAKAAAGSNAYAEGLYWRAVLAGTAADAEMDYRRIIVDYPLSPRVEDVLLRLSQLELARADYDAALQHLNRLVSDHPTGPARARAGYWMARVLFEKNDVPRACAANADALARTADSDTELRNQITYLNQRCVGVALASPAPAPSTQPARPDSSVVVAKTEAAAPPPPPSPPPAPVAPTGSTVKATKPPMKLPASPNDSKPSVIAETLPKSAVAKTPAESSESGGYSVQIAAYNVKSQADAMVSKLRKNGYEARVDGKVAPFRVRIGRYGTQAQATAVLRSLRAKRMDGFVVKAG